MTTTKQGQLERDPLRDLGWFSAVRAQLCSIASARSSKTNRPRLCLPPQLTLFRQGRLDIALLALVVLLGGQAAKADVIERVVAVVDDQAIFLSELRTRAAPFLGQIAAAPTEVERMAALDQLYSQLLDQLIAEELIHRAADEMQIRVATADIDRAIENVRRQSRLSAEQFWEAVRAQGFTEPQYRSDVRRQLLRLKVLNQRARGRVNVTEADVRREYDRRMGQANRLLRFRASHVFFPVAAGASATEVAAVRRAAESVRQTLGPANFDDAVATHAGGELGWLVQGDLPRELDDVLATLETGAISAPVRGPNGFHILLLHERERGSESLAGYRDMREAIFNEMIETAMARQETLLLDDLRRRADIRKRLSL